MTAWIEFKDDGITYTCLNSVRVVDEFAVITYVDNMLGGVCGSRKKEDKEIKVVHFKY